MSRESAWCCNWINRSLSVLVTLGLLFFSGLILFEHQTAIRAWLEWSPVDTVEREVKARMPEDQPEFQLRIHDDTPAPPAARSSTSARPQSGTTQRSSAQRSRSSPSNRPSARPAAPRTPADEPATEDHR